MGSVKQYRRWKEVMDTEYERLVFACTHGYRTLLDCYGATNPAEFFAVATECFFQLPRHMAAQHPDLYEIFRDFYRQDPAQREG